MMRRLRKSLRQMVIDRMLEQSTMDIDEVICLMEDFGFEIDNDQAIYQAKRRQAISLIATAKDENGIRKIFATKDENNQTRFTDVENEKKSAILKDVRVHLGKLKNGIQRSFKKVSKLERKAIHAELSLFDNHPATKGI